MSFTDLPDDIRDLPLDDPHLAADVVDLFCDPADRESGCILFLITDPRARLAQPLLLSEIGGGPSTDEITRGVAPLLLHHQGDGIGVVIARGRPGPALLTDADRALHDGLAAVCRSGNIRLLGMYLATRAGVRRLPDHLLDQDAERVAS